MIGAAPRPSLYVLVVAHVDAGARCAIEVFPYVGAGVLTLAAAPALITIKVVCNVGSVLFDLLVLVACWWLGLDDEEPCYGDAGVA